MIQKNTIEAVRVNYLMIQKNTIIGLLERTIFFN